MCGLSITNVDNTAGAFIKPVISITIAAIWGTMLLTISKAIVGISWLG